MDKSVLDQLGRIEQAKLKVAGTYANDASYAFAKTLDPILKKLNITLQFKLVDYDFQGDPKSVYITLIDNVSQEKIISFDYKEDMLTLFRAKDEDTLYAVHERDNVVEYQNKRYGVDHSENLMYRSGEQNTAYDAALTAYILREVELFYAFRSEMTITSIEETMMRQNVQESLGLNN